MPSGETEENPSFSKSKPHSKPPASSTERSQSPTSPRPLAAGPLGGKSAECFIWSAAHDDDAEFLRRFAGSHERAKFMLTFHAEDPATEQARERLSALYVEK
jgi:hypothetical protein